MYVEHCHSHPNSLLFAWSEFRLELIANLPKQKVPMHLWANGSLVLNNLPNITKKIEVVKYVYDNFHIIILLEDHDTITMIEMQKIS